ncbi:MAG: hypothetical protein COW85_10110 [Ignavibacteria bacterium CG22_combo_CG10-13_8_21_14_all_37_15]|nr:MAG: hypothetical protein COW85_10110 [Ignavibacteria bacterium CG22_combo_CG10-13_8_21_14_all_37_15]
MKKLSKVLIVFVLISLFCGYFTYSVKGNPPINSQSIVEKLYSNINSKKFSENHDLFMYSDADIIAYGKGQGIASKNKRSASNWIDWQYSEKQWNHYIDDIEVKNLSNTLCAIFVKGHTGSWRVDFDTIFILSKKHGEWKIVSMTQENG